MPIRLLQSLKQRVKRVQHEALALWFATFDLRTPWYARAMAVMVTAYAFSPIDLIPDFIPVLGYLDDLVLIPIGIALTCKFIPENVMADARLKADITLHKPVNWWAGSLILLAWVSVLAFLLRAGWQFIISNKIWSH